MRYGLYLPNFGAFGEARRVASIAAEAEAAGWDGLFLWDHITRSFRTPVVDPWVALAAAAMTTETIRLGALVTPIARRRPWKVAREAASVDRLSGGRLIFGAGTGSSGGAHVEWEAFGEETDLKQRGDMLDEGLDVLAGLWSGESFSYSGRYYQVQETRFEPTPEQRPRIPVWIGGYWRGDRPGGRPFRRAARWDGVFPLFGHDSPLGAHCDALRDCVDHVRTLRGSDAFEVAHLSPPTPGDDLARGAEIVASFADAGATWWLEHFGPVGFGGSWEGDWPLDAMRERIAQGPPRG